MQVLYDERFLYFAITAFQDSEIPLVARQFIQERTIAGDDHVEIILDPFSTRKTGYSFAVNPNGIRTEALIQNTNEIDDDWDPDWYAAVMKLPEK